MNLKDYGLEYWLPAFLAQSVSRFRVSCEPVHVMVCVVDHFEPFNGDVGLETARARVAHWVRAYPAMARGHRDADGRPPQHVWFYPPHLDHSFLPQLAGLCADGYGEIEMHLHHNHMEPFPDDERTLAGKIMRCIDDYSKWGIFCLPDGTKRFGFIHGDWSLCNARGPRFCGVNNELTVLKRCGCYADFTFPSLGQAQPAMINTMYYAKDDAARPKGYNRGRPVAVGKEPAGTLMMIPGIIGLRWESRTHRFRPSIEASNLDQTDCPFPARIDYWIRNAIRVEGRPDWAFLKLHTHGAREDTWESLLGGKADAMFRYLEDTYNDGRRFVLHYVTAREMYNIVKAAEAGKHGNPGDYRDFEIGRYVYLTKG